MKEEQQFTPKYWIFHDKTMDDVLIKTASKSHGMCLCKAENLYPHLVEKYFDDDNNYMISLFEIKQL